MSNSSSASDEPKRLNLTIRLTSGRRFTPNPPPAGITTATTVSVFKSLVAATMARHAASSTSSDEAVPIQPIPAARQRLVYRGKILSDGHKTLGEYGVEDGGLIYLVKGADNSDAGGNGGVQVAATAGGAGDPSPMARLQAINNAASAPSASSASSGANAAAAPMFNPFAPPVAGNTGIGSNQQQQMQDPLASLMQMQNLFGGAGAGPNGAGGMPDLAQLQNQLRSNPELMQQMLDNPFMQSLMDNPTLMQNMMEHNPQMQSLLQSNPELRHALQDPELMRQSMQMMRDPSAMRNMMRQQDIAMSNIENMPGGFDALRRMYTEVQEPMMEAMSGGSGGGQEGEGSGGSGSGDNARRDGGVSGAAGAAMPNPWGSSSTSPTQASNGTAANGAGANSSAPFNPWASLATGAGAGASAGGNPWASMGAAGAGANGMPSMPGMPANMDMEQTLQMLENPLVQQMMESMMANPAMLESMMASNPMLAQLRQSNPQMASMLSNPEFMRTMMNPQVLRSMMQLQQSMGGAGGGGGMPGFPGMAGSPGGAGGAGMDFASLLGSMQGANLSSPGGAGGGSAAVNRPPEERYRVQLQSLRDMGFDDDATNIRVLEQNHGNVNRAIDFLLTQPMPAPAPAAPAAPAASTESSSGGDGGGSTDANDEGGEKGEEAKKND